MDNVGVFLGLLYYILVCIFLGSCWVIIIIIKLYLREGIIVLEVFFVGEVVVNKFEFVFFDVLFDWVE